MHVVFAVYMDKNNCPLFLRQVMHITAGEMFFKALSGELKQILITFFCMPVGRGLVCPVCLPCLSLFLLCQSVCVVYLPVHLSVLCQSACLLLVSCASFNFRLSFDPTSFLSACLCSFLVRFPVCLSVSFVRRVACPGRLASNSGPRCRVVIGCRSSRKKRSRSRDRKRSKSRERKRSRSRERKRSREKRRSRSRERRRSRERGGRYRDYHKARKRSRSRSPIRREKSPIRREKSPIRREKSPNKPLVDNLTPEERDARTVFCMQLAARIRPRDLEDFFSAVGKVRDVRMISDRNSRRSKGIAYIEFVEASSVPLAIGLTGQRLLGVPIIVQASQAEKNRAAAAAAAANNLQKGTSGPMRLYIGSLHFNITEEMLRGIFEPFGRIEGIQLMMDSETGRSKGYGFITFADAECAKKALEQLNGFELAGRPMKVGHVTERSDGSAAASLLDSDELERTGIDLGTTGRLQLMARLAEGTGLQIPPAAQQALQMSGAIAIGAMAAVSAAMNPSMNLNMNPPALNLPSQPLATHCFQLSNMFNPSSEDHPGWEMDIQHDVIEECNKHGGVVHIYVDKNSTEGNVYVKCPSIPAAMAAVSALHGRYFAGNMIKAAYVPLPAYHNLFPDAATATQLVVPPPRR